jgi:hypothetical protein
MPSSEEQQLNCYLQLLNSNSYIQDQQLEKIIPTSSLTTNNNNTNIKLKSNNENENNNYYKDITISNNKDFGDISYNSNNNSTNNLNINGKKFDFNDSEKSIWSYNPEESSFRVYFILLYNIFTSYTLLYNS